MDSRDAQERVPAAKPLDAALILRLELIVELLPDPLAWRTLPTLVVIIALAAFIGGFITLVARLPRDRGDGSDDGAVV